MLLPTPSQPNIPSIEERGAQDCKYGKVRSACNSARSKDAGPGWDFIENTTQ